MFILLDENIWVLVPNQYPFKVVLDVILNPFKFIRISQFSYMLKALYSLIVFVVSMASYHATPLNTARYFQERDCSDDAGLLAEQQGIPLLVALCKVVALIKFVQISHRGLLLLL